MVAVGRQANETSAMSRSRRMRAGDRRRPFPKSANASVMASRASSFASGRSVISTTTTTAMAPSPSGAQRRAEFKTNSCKRVRGDFQATAIIERRVGHWAGMYLDAPPVKAAGWQEIAEIVEDAYCLVAAPRALVRLLDNGWGGHAAATMDSACAFGPRS